VPERRTTQGEKRCTCRPANVAARYNKGSERTSITATCLSTRGADLGVRKIERKKKKYAQREGGRKKRLLAYNRRCEIARYTWSRKLYRSGGVAVTLGEGETGAKKKTRAGTKKKGLSQPPEEKSISGKTGTYRENGT